MLKLPSNLNKGRSKSMDKAEFTKLAFSLSLLFPGAFPEKNLSQTIDAWYGVIADLPSEKVSKAAAMIAREVEYLRQGTNLGAMLRNRCTADVTVETVEAQLYRAIELAKLPTGEPYKFLRGVSPRLLEIAEACDLFNRDMTSESMSYRVRDAAKQYCAERENARKGFRIEPLPTSRQIEAKKQDMPSAEEQQAINREGYAKFKETLAALKRAIKPEANEQP